MAQATWATSVRSIRSFRGDLEAAAMVCRELSAADKHCVAPSPERVQMEDAARTAGGRCSADRWNAPVAGRGLINGPNTASHPAATFGLFHELSRSNPSRVRRVTAGRPPKVA